MGQVTSVDQFQLALKVMSNSTMRLPLVVRVTPALPPLGANTTTLTPSRAAPRLVRPPYTKSIVERSPGYAASTAADLCSFSHASKASWMSCSAPSGIPAAAMK
ncbi:MAG: hypothetical protein LC789_18645 [Actinobacteria bacterium]|nr:hypothetical protein [Actinomycetota bacterium]